MNLQIIKLGLPLILSQSIQTVMLLTDRYILSQKNPLYTSVVTTGGFTALSLTLLFIHLLFFSTSLIAKRYGQNDLKSCHIIVRQCFVISTFSLFVLWILSNTSDFYFKVLGHPSDYRSIENSYFQILMLSQILVLYKTSFESYFLGVDRSRNILISNLIGMIANIPITYMFVIGDYADFFEGTTGAAWGTVCANFLSLIYLGLIYYHKTDVKSYNISWHATIYESEWRELLMQGSFAGLEKFTNSFCFVCFVNMFVHYGKEMSTAVSVVFSWDQVAFLPIMGMYGAVMSLYSRFLGQGNHQSAVQSLHSAVRLTFGLMLFFSILFWISADKLVTAFIKDKSEEMNYLIVYRYATFFLKTTCLYIFANAAIFLYKAALRSLGFSSWCFKISLIIHLLLVGSCYSGIYVFGVGPKIVWSFFICMLITLAFTFIAKFYWTIKFKGVIFTQKIKVGFNKKVKKKI